MLFDKFPTIQTNRLILRELSLNDVQDMFEIFKDNEVLKKEILF